MSWGIFHPDVQHSHKCGYDASMNEHEASLAIFRLITEVLVDLAADEDETEEDLISLTEAMDDASALIIEALGMVVHEVKDDGTILVTLSLKEFDDDYTV